MVATIASGLSADVYVVITKISKSNAVGAAASARSLFALISLALSPPVLRTHNAHSSGRHAEHVRERDVSETWATFALIMSWQSREETGCGSSPSDRDPAAAVFAAA